MTDASNPPVVRPQPVAGRRRALAAGSALALGAALPGTVRAQSDWPSRPVRLVVPFPAGGAADLGARAVAVHLANLFGKPVPVENRAGADGAVAALEVIKSPADGHSLYFGTATSMSYTPSIRKNPPYDPVADFTPISNVCVFTFYFAVAPTVPATTLAEFVAHVKANPGKLSYATGNSTGILASAQLVAGNKLEMTHVPYKGEAQAVIDLVGGRVQAMFATPAVLPQLLERKFRLLAVLLPQRTRAFPDVPTMAEAGQPLVNISPWGGLFAPAKLPRELVDRISRDFNVVMRRPDVVEQFDKLGLLPLPSTPDELAGIVRDQLGVFSRAMREAGIQQE
ncbi:MAG: tripartite tricarboxylate transporter substrate binding protein [Burkholderiales bacterium]|nr:MAG: tripartite tricarboxylate transporter substrate binding protein [Burkholderiales bacterium]